MLIFALMLLAVFGKSIVNLILILAILDSTRVFRLARAVGAECRGAWTTSRRRRLRGERLGWIIFARDPAQHPAAADRRVRPALLLRLPHHRGAVLPRRRHPAAHRRLGLHGARERKTLITYRRRHAALSRRRAIALLTVGGQFRGRLVPASRRAGCAMSTEQDNAARQGRSRSSKSGASDRGLQRRRLAPDRQGHRPHAEARRGAGPDRRIRRRQIDHRPCRHGLCPARLPHHRRLDHVRRHRSRRRPSEEELRELRGSRIAYVAQSAAASFNPAHRSSTRRSRPRCDHGIMDARRGRSRRRAISTGACSLPNPDTIGERYPHQVSGGQLQRAMTAMAMSCRPDLIIFDEPTTALDVTTQVEVLAAIARHRRAVQHGGDLHHPRPRRGGPDGRTASWCCATASWSRKRRPARC